MASRQPWEVLREATRRTGGGHVRGGTRPDFAGVIVVAPSEADESPTGEQKAVLDALHLRKIDLADRILIVNPGGYVGESTRREIAYAQAVGKPVTFTDPI